MFIRQLFRIAVVALINCVVFTESSYSAVKNKSGTTSAQLLEIVPDARLMGMGNAFGALPGEAGSIFSNPAGLATIDHVELALARNFLFEDMEHNYAGLIYSLHDVRISNLRNSGTLAITMNLLDSGNITGRNETGNPTADFTVKDRLFTLAYGKIIFDKYNFGTFTTGVSAKFYREEVLDRKFRGEAFDIGLLWKYPRKNFFIGLAAQNIGSGINYVNERFKFPYKTTLGIAGKMFQEKLIADVDFVKAPDSDFEYNLGLEYHVLGTPFALRLGYNTQTGEGSALTTGFGLILKQLDAFFFYAREIGIDYAFIPYGDIGNSHRISVNLKLGAE